MKKTNSSYTKMSKVKSSKKTAEVEGIGFTGIATGGTQMMKSQSANIKPLAWKNQAQGQIITKTRQNAPAALENTDALADTVQFPQGSKMSKKQTPIGGSDKIRPGFAGDFNGGKKSRGGDKQTNIPMMGALNLEDLKQADLENHQKRKGNQSKRSYQNNYMSGFSNDSRPRKQTVLKKNDNFISNLHQKTISIAPSDSIKTLTGFSKNDRNAESGTSMMQSSSLLQTFNQQQNKYMKIQSNTTSINMKRDDSVLSKKLTMKEKKLIMKKDKEDPERSELGDDDVNPSKFHQMYINRGDRVQTIASQYNITGPQNQNWNQHNAKEKKPSVGIDGIEQPGRFNQIPTSSLGLQPPYQQAYHQQSLQPSFEHRPAGGYQSTYEPYNPSQRPNFPTGSNSIIQYPGTYRPSYAQGPPPEYLPGPPGSNYQDPYYQPVAHAYPEYHPGSTGGYSRPMATAPYRPSQAPMYQQHHHPRSYHPLPQNHNHQARRVPILSLEPNMGYDYVFYMQKERIEKIRQKKRDKGILRPPGMCGVKNRLIHKSRATVARNRVRNKEGRFIGGKNKINDCTKTENSAEDNETGSKQEQ